MLQLLQESQACRREPREIDYNPFTWRDRSIYQSSARSSTNHSRIANSEVPMTLVDILIGGKFEEGLASMKSVVESEYTK
jgi:hypothetical protein